MHIHPDLWPVIAVAVVAFVGLLVGAAWLARRWRTLTPRTRWALFAALALFETAYWLNVYAWLVEPNLLAVRRVEIVSEHWHGAPLTIAVLGDTHVSWPHMDSARMRRIVGRVNELRPEIVVLLGDYVGGSAPAANRTAAGNAEVLSGIAAFAAFDARYGAIAVIGNHDSWYDRTAITGALEAAGVATLWNRHVVIARSGARFVVAGLADLETGVPDYEQAIDGAPPNTDIVVLTHSPDVFDNVSARAALILAGHTHCGQVTVPFFGRPVTASDFGQRFACGVINENGRSMFVTAGIGTSKLPVRFLNPPEIALITLRAAD